MAGLKNTAFQCIFLRQEKEQNRSKHNTYSNMGTLAYLQKTTRSSYTFTRYRKLEKLADLKKTASECSFLRGRQVPQG